MDCGFRKMDRDVGNGTCTGYFYTIIYHPECSDYSRKATSLRSECLRRGQILAASLFNSM